VCFAKSAAMCVCVHPPFAIAGDRDGFSSDDAACFFSAVKTILVVRPAAFILENVSSILSEPHIGKLTAALGVLKDYRWKALRLNSHDYRVPQQRVRCYIVGLRVDAVEGGAEAALEEIADDMVSVKHQAPAWTEYLEACILTLGTRDLCVFDFGAHVVT
jgi:site-specific DNA-cytosine methylase